jgi:DNA-binding MarR family transcriptional regulator
VVSNKDIFQRDIEELLQIRRSTASTLLQGMEAKGLIRREPVAFDARLKKLVLTEKSIAAHKQIATNISSFENKLTKDILEEELKTFFQVINKIKNNLTK